MEDFAKTRAGKKFLEMDIPKLADALERLAEAMTESNKIEEKKLVLEQKRFLNEKRNSNAKNTESLQENWSNK
jgi:hypothetical protein